MRVDHGVTALGYHPTKRFEVRVGNVYYHCDAVHFFDQISAKRREATCLAGSVMMSPTSLIR
jgi:hypothetical protein